MRQSLKYGTATTLLVAMAISPMYSETAYAAGSALPRDLKQAGMYGPDPAVYRNEKDIPELLGRALPFMITVAGGVVLITAAGVKLIRHMHRHPESQPNEKIIEFDEEPVESNEEPTKNSESEISASESSQPEDENATQSHD